MLSCGALHCTMLEALYAGQVLPGVFHFARSFQVVEDDQDEGKWRSSSFRFTNFQMIQFSNH
jgi:hypothetical protein